MGYEPYASASYYMDEYGGESLPREARQMWLKRASRHIDSLTFNRIIGQGFASLSPFQQELVKEVCCEQADFEYQNREIFDMVLSGYSINGVAMQFGESWNVVTRKGIPMRRDVYDKLCQTGLCCRLL
mgnify:CR=1 FL=1